MLRHDAAPDTALKRANTTGNRCNERAPLPQPTLPNTVGRGMCACASVVQRDEARKNAKAKQGQGLGTVVVVIVVVAV